jgi:hypothetical protein
VFTDKSISYEEGITVKDGIYAWGVLGLENGQFKVWGFGLKADVKNDKNIKEMYEEIFQLLSDLKKTKNEQ